MHDGLRTQGKAQAWPRLATLLSGLALLAGCEAANATAIYVEGNMVPQATLVGGILTCTYSGAANYYMDGVMDVALARSMKFVAAVQNKLPPMQQVNGNSVAQLRLDPNLVTITKVKVTMTRAAPNATKSSPFATKNSAVTKINKSFSALGQTSWEVSAYATIPPASRGVVGFDLVPEWTGPGKPLGAEWQQRFFDMKTDRAKVTERLVLSFSLVGTTAGGNTVESGTVDYPVDVCWGCLLAVPADPKAETPKDQWKACSEMKTDSSFQEPCAPGNYDVLPCGYYCKKCKADESKSIGPGCDPDFCPALN